MAFQHVTVYPNWRKYSTLKTDKKCFLVKKQKECSVADPGCLYRIQDPNFSILVPDPGSKRSRLRIRIKAFLTQTTAFKLSDKWSGMFILDPGSGFFPLPDPGPKKQGFGSGSALIWVAGSGSAFKLQIRIRIQEGKNVPHTVNREKSRIFMFLSTGCSLLRDESVSCSLGVLYGGLGVSKLQFLIKKIEIKFPAINFLNFRSSNTGSGSALNQCGSETLQKSTGSRIRFRNNEELIILTWLWLSSLGSSSPSTSTSTLTLSR